VQLALPPGCSWRGTVKTSGSLFWSIVQAPLTVDEDSVKLLLACVGALVYGLSWDMALTWRKTFGGCAGGVRLSLKTRASQRHDRCREDSKTGSPLALGTTGTTSTTRSKDICIDPGERGHVESLF
jgi:hypothetical protein